MVVMDSFLDNKEKALSSLDRHVQWSADNWTPKPASTYDFFNALLQNSRTTLCENDIKVNKVRIKENDPLVDAYLANVLVLFVNDQYTLPVKDMKGVSPYTLDHLSQDVPVVERYVRFRTSAEYILVRYGFFHAPSYRRKKDSVLSGAPLMEDRHFLDNASLFYRSALASANEMRFSSPEHDSMKKLAEYIGEAGLVLRRARLLCNDGSVRTDNDVAHMIDNGWCNGS